ncbi:hypothetical protein ABK040_005917 [Willaertia magna]
MTQDLRNNSSINGNAFHVHNPFQNPFSITNPLNQPIPIKTAFKTSPMNEDNMSVTTAITNINELNMPSNQIDSSDDNSSNYSSSSSHKNIKNSNNLSPKEPSLNLSEEKLLNDSTISFSCIPCFNPNNSRKAPSETTHHASIRDKIIIQGKSFKDCEACLKLKDDTSSGVVVVTNPFKSKNNTFECIVPIPPKITQMKGSSCSRVCFVEIRNKEDKVIATSSAFWIRSRSRQQLSKDLKRKQKEEDSAVDVVPVVNNNKSNKKKNDSIGKRKRKEDEESKAAVELDMKHQKKEEKVAVNSNETNNSDAALASATILPSIANIISPNVNVPIVVEDEIMKDDENITISKKKYQKMESDIKKLKSVVEKQQYNISWLSKFVAAQSQSIIALQRQVQEILEKNK